MTRFFALSLERWHYGVMRHAGQVVTAREKCVLKALFGYQWQVNQRSEIYLYPHHHVQLLSALLPL